MTLLKFRKATKKDIQGVAILMLSEFKKPPYNEKTSLKSVIKSLKYFLKIGKIFMTVKRKEIVGVMVFKIEQWWQGKVIIIEDLAIKQEFKKQSIGKKLLKKIEAFAKNNKIKLVCLKTNKKSKAIKFYKKYGYTIRTDIIEIEKKLF